MRFKKGDKVTPSKNSEWRHDAGRGEVNEYAPKFGEIVTVNHYDTISNPWGKCWVNFDEYPLPDSENGLPQYFNDKLFEPLVSDAVLREELETVKEPYTI